MIEGGNLVKLEEGTLASGSVPTKPPKLHKLTPRQPLMAHCTPLRRGFLWDRLAKPRDHAARFPEFGVLVDRQLPRLRFGAVVIGAGEHALD
jgi:hypothetical protein